MQEHIFLENYGNDDVCSFGSKMFKVSRLREVMRAAVNHSLEDTLKQLLYKQLEINTFGREAWFSDGIDCETLKIGGKGWQKGKVKIKVILEFCPDEPEVDETPENDDSETSQPESPLDDLRRQLLDRENSPS